MNSTSFFYAHTDQWRYEKLGMEEILSPLADARAYHGAQIDYNVQRRAHGLAAFSSPAQDQPHAGGQGRCCGGHGRRGLRRSSR